VRIVSRNATRQLSYHVDDDAYKGQATDTVVQTASASGMIMYTKDRQQTQVRAAS
jgi:hypothetical protein